MHTILIKIGGSVVTKSGNSPINIRAINQLAHELKGIRHKVVVVHGTGYIGKPPALEYGYIKSKQLPARKAKTALRVRSQIADLSRTIAQCFSAAGIAVMPLDNTHFFSLPGNASHDDTLVALIANLTKFGIIPLLSGNFIPTRRGTFKVLSSDELMLVLARLIRPKRVIFLSDVDGVLDRAQDVIPYFNRRMLKDIGSSAHDVSGGMKTKLKTALALLEFCKDCTVANGTKKGVLKGLMNDRAFGTKIR